MWAKVGIHSVEQLWQSGGVNAFLTVHAADVMVSMSLLYALHGTLTDTHWNKLIAKPVNPC